MRLNDIYSNRKKTLKKMDEKRRLANVEVLSCRHCGAEIAKQVWQRELYVCEKCGKYMPVPARERVEQLVDEGSFRELFSLLKPYNPLNFEGYEQKLLENKEKTGLEDAFYAGIGRIYRRKVALGVLDSAFLMGSMGTVVGEKIARLTELARRKKLPLIIISASGGARMQEGLFSLMQMAKTSAAIEQFKQEGGLFISCLSNPTTGGVSASYASLGDIILAEPDALIGFAGPRVIEQTIGQTLPEGFQKSEFLLEHGMVDRVVPRQDLRRVLNGILRLHP